LSAFSGGETCEKRVVADGADTAHGGRTRRTSGTDRVPQDVVAEKTLEKHFADSARDAFVGPEEGWIAENPLLRIRRQGVGS
jgi:hypothetical protein